MVRYTWNYHFANKDGGGEWRRMYFVVIFATIGKFMHSYRLDMSSLCWSVFGQKHFYPIQHGQIQIIQGSC